MKNDERTPMTSRRALRFLIKSAAGALLAATLAATSGAYAQTESATLAQRTDKALLAQALGAVENLAESGDRPRKALGVRLTAAVSTSLSAVYRQELTRDAARAGIRLAVRGLPVPTGFEKRTYFGADAREKAAQKSEIVQGAARLHEAFGAVEVDPGFFRTHAIERVPVFVLEDDAGVIARVHGSVSVAYALERLYEELVDAGRPVNRTIGSVRLSEAKKAVVRAGCALRRGALGDFSFMGEACE